MIILTQRMTGDIQPVMRFQLKRRRTNEKSNIHIDPYNNHVSGDNNGIGNIGLSMPG